MNAMLSRRGIDFQISKVLKKISAAALPSYGKFFCRGGIPADRGQM
jgi:hypothetical protein